MKKIVLLVTFLIAAMVSQAQPTPIVFNGDPISPYAGQEVCFNQTLYVVGRVIYTNSRYLHLSYERLQQAEDVAVEGTAAFDSIVESHSRAVITARCDDIDVNAVRLGATITNLVATVRNTGERNILIEGDRTFSNNTRPTQRPDVGDARLIVCASNLQYFCPEWDGTYGAGSDEEFALQRHKTVKALININADIYALEELQQGATSLDTLVAGMNNSSVPGRYAHIEDYDPVTCKYIKVGFIYRTDKVRPVLHLGHPYAPSSSVYYTQVGNYRRMLLQCFEEIATGERFVVALSHFKSKSGGDSTNNYYNSNRVTEARRLLQFIDNEQNNNYYNDPDFLLLGDLNCGSMEEPVRILTDSIGYENLLRRYAPQEYSYSFSDEVEYLDHAIASPTMAAQVTGARPYHINADESYQLHYDYGTDSSMYRYADHDPLIIGVTLASESVDSCRGLHIEESFAENFGCFEAQDMAGERYWYNYPNYECAALTGNGSANTDWLVGPTLNLTHHTDASISFDQTFGYGTPNTWGYYCKLLISNDYNGNISSATWAQLPMPEMPEASWQWVHNEIVIPSSYWGRPSVTLAFKYEIFTTSDNPTWELKNVVIDAVCDTMAPGISSDGLAGSGIRIWSAGGRIRVESEIATTIEVYDMMGRCIYYREGAGTAELAVPATGVYIVRCGTVVKKVILL